MRPISASRFAALVTMPALMLIASCGGGGDTTTEPPVPVASTLQLISGSNQHARITRALADPIIVSATTASGAAVANTSITFTATAGVVDPAVATTDASGRASVRWTLGTTAGAQSLTARLTAGTASTVIAATADPALDVVVTALDGDRQQAIVGTAVFIPPTVRVTDRAGAPVADVRLHFATNGGSVLSVAEPRTDADGRATVGAWTMGGAAGATQATLTFADGDVVSSSALPTFNATMVAIGGVATSPARTYTINTSAATSLRDTVSGWRIDFPAGGHGSLIVARVVGGATLPDAGFTRATIQFSGSERVELAVIRPVGGDVDGYLFGQVYDALTSGKDSVRWWGLPAQTVRGDTVSFLVQPSASALRTNNGSAMSRSSFTSSLTMNARPAVQAYGSVPIPASSPSMTVRAQLRAATRQTINWWLANLPSGASARLQTALDANPLAMSFGTSGESYYWNSLFTGYTPTIFYNTTRDISHITRHEPAHYLTHMLVGTPRYAALLASAPGEGHDLGAVANGFRQSMIEEYAHFTEFLINGNLTNYDLRSVSTSLGVRGLMAPYTPATIDFPSLEGFAGVMLAAPTRAGVDTLVADFFAQGSRTRSPALAMATSQLMGVLSTGPLTPDDLRAALQSEVGGEAILSVLMEPVGWSYNGLGRLLDDTGAPVQGAEIASVMRVGSVDYRTTGSTMTGSDGRFYLPRIFPGTSRLRMYKPRSGGGVDSVELGNFTVPWSTPTSQTIAITDQRLTSYNFTNLTITIGTYAMVNSANPSQQWACLTTGGINTNPLGSTGTPTAPLQWDGARFAGSGETPVVASDWRGTHTVTVSGTVRKGGGDTTFADIQATYTMRVEDLRYDATAGGYIYKLGTDRRSTVQLHDVPLRMLGTSATSMNVYLTNAAALAVITSSNLYYFNKDWSHPEYDAMCQSSALIPGQTAVNVYFSR